MMNTTGNRFNTLIKYLYVILVAVPVVFLLISIGSYCSVYHDFGDVPSTGVDFQVFEGEINVFPTTVGKVLVLMFFICAFIVMPVVMIVNSVLAIVTREIVFHRLPALTLFAINALALSLVFTELAGWYVGYVLS